MRNISKTPGVNRGIYLRMNMFRMGSVGLVAFALLAGCTDPAKDKTKATTGEATTASVSSPETKAAPGATASYAIEPATSKIDWTGSKVTAKHEGNFGSFKGTIALVDGAPEKSSINIDIDMDSLKTEPEKLVGHLKSPDLFDTAKFPKATFASTAITKGGTGTATHTIAGNLTLHGVTKSITFPATIKVTPAEADGDAEFTINRKDFGVVYPGMANDLIRDDIVIKLTIRAPKKAA